MSFSFRTLLLLLTAVTMLFVVGNFAYRHGVENRSERIVEVTITGWGTEICGEKTDDEILDELLEIVDERPTLLRSFSWLFAR